MARLDLRRGILSALLVAVVVAPMLGQEPQNDPALRDYLSANGLLNRGLHELAAAEYRKFLAQSATHEKAPIARYGLAVCLFRMSDHAGAEAELTPLASIKDFSFAAEVGLLLGQCQLATLRYSDAEKTLSETLRRHAKSELADDAAALLVEASYQADHCAAAARTAEQYMSRWPEGAQRERVEFLWGLSLAGSDPAAAVQRLNSYLENSPTGKYAPQALVALGQSQQRLGEHGRAGLAYRRALESLSDAEKPDALVGLCSALFAQDKAGEAAPLLEQALALAPQGAHVPIARLLQGRLLLEKDVIQASVYFEQAAADEALRDDAAYWLAKGLLRQEKFADAAARLQRALEEFPKSELRAEMSYDRAVALARANELPAAATAAEDFLSNFGDSPLAASAWRLLAVCLHQQKRYDESQKHCRGFQQRYPEHELAAQIAFLMAENDFLAGRMEEALRGFTAFERRYADDAQAPQANLRIGLALHRLGRAEEASKRLASVPSDAASGGSAALALGDIHFQRGEWKQAERRLDEYLAVSDAQPLRDEALLKLGLAQQRQGRNADALKAYDQLLASFPKSAHRLQAGFERGQTLLALERWDEAQGAFEETLKQEVGGRFAPFARQHLGAIALRQGRGAAAIEQLSAAIDAQPEGDGAALALFQRAQARFSTTDYAGAATDYERFISTYPKDARFAEAQARLAISLSRLERFADAAKVLEAMRKLGSEKLDPALRRATRYETAWGLQKLGKPNEAAAIFRELIAEPDALGVSAALAVAELEAAEKKYQDAAERLRSLLIHSEALGDASPPGAAEAASYRLGICEFELGQHEPAATTLERFIEKHPQSALLASASYFCGEALFRAGKNDAAASHFQRVVERYPDDAAFSASQLRLGEVSALLQRWARSEQVFSDYLARFKDQPMAYQARFGVGWARENQGRYDEAIAAYREVIASHQGPTAARAQFQIGECLFARKQFEEATRELLKVDILYGYDEWSAAALFEAGRCFEAMNKSVEARAQYKAVAEKYAGTRWAELSSQRLAELGKAGLPG